MKKTLLLTLATGLVCATPLMADVDIYLTGSTAFRSNVHDACLKLFQSTPTKFYDTTGTIGGDGTSGNSNPVWTFTGTPTNSITALATAGQLTIHADFTGSVQGMQAAQNGVKIWYLSSTGGVVSNTATIAFSDNSSTATPYPVDGTSYNEEQVAVQPFVFVKSNNQGAMTNINNITWEQVNYMIKAGRIPLASWTFRTNDMTNFVYLINRTKDSGTRRTTYAYAGYGYNQSQTTYNYDATNNVFYKATNTLAASRGGVSNNIVSYGVVGAPGVGGANLGWGSGYVGGGDVRSAVGVVNSNNLSIGYLSFSDARTVVNTAGSNWTQVVSLNGVWPTAAGAGLYGHTGTNDFSPVTIGSYGNWGYEVVVYPLKDPSTLYADQNMLQSQVGDQNTAGTFLGVLDAVSAGAASPGSLDFEIETSKTGGNGATAIRLGNMLSSRASVGGTVAP